MKKNTKKGKVKLFKKIKLQSTRSKVLAVCTPCIAIAIVVAILLSGSGTSFAGDSLPHIETILRNLRGTGTFTITEVYQNSEDRYFGYYIDGQEPDIGNWRSVLAGLGTFDERRDYVNGLETILSAAGVLGSAPDGGPITWIENYSETLPWISTDGTRLNIANNVYTLPGTMVHVGSGGGSYSANYKYTPTPQGSGDDSDVLLVNNLRFGESGEYYFDITNGGLRFSGGSSEGFDFPGSEMRFDEPVYARYENGDIIYEDALGNNADENGDPYDEFSPGVNPRVENYRYYYVIDTANPDSPGVNRAYPEVGTALYTLNSDEQYIFSVVIGTDFDLNLDYYVVTDYGLADEAAGNYAVGSHSGIHAVGDFPPDSLTDGARFKRDIDDYSYAGEGNGDFDYIFDDSEPDTINVDVWCDIVFYKGGFRNNNWFLRHVFNRETSQLGDYSGKIIVNSVRDTSLTDSHIVNSDLIVLTAGISLSESNALTIFNASTATGGYKPVMFARSLGASSGYEGALTRALASKPTNQAPVTSLPSGSIIYDNGVNDNVFWTTMSADDLLNEYPYISPIGFEDVKTEIDDENFLRVQQGMSGSDLLEEVIHNGTAIRYIINFSGKRSMPQLEEINVLEIQGGLTIASGLTPGAGSFVPNDSDLTEAMVRRWIGDETMPYRVHTINIVRMTTYEFVGRIEDLNEQYHLIYIGGSARGMNEFNGESRYNDSSMNGMVYTNIGDRYRVAGVYNSDNAHARTIVGLVNTADDANGWYRLSGNDITIPKMQDIIDFADAGYPVVIDDRLVSGAAQARIQVVMADNGSTFSFMSSPLSGASYRWYRGTPANVVSTDSSFSIPADTANIPGSVGTLHSFYCAITYNGETITVGPLNVQLRNENIPGAARWPTTPCPGCGATNWRGTLGDWFQCENAPGYEIPNKPTGNRWFCGLQFRWTDGPGSYNTNGNDWPAGTYQIPSDAFEPGTTQIVGQISTSVALDNFPGDGRMRVNNLRVDNCSNMYITLNTILSKPNVYPAVSAAESPDNVRRYLNLSKPELDLHVRPTEYVPPAPGGVMNSNADGSVFRYEFTIRNLTEAVPHLTTYDIELFLDLNGDGRYTSFEKQNDIVVRRASDNAVQSRDTSGRYTLEADVRYIATKQMPDGAVGLFDWSLRATKNDHLNPSKRNVRASESGLTRIDPDGNVPTINILQIASSTINDAGNFDYKNRQQRVNLEWQQRLLSPSRIADTRSTDRGNGTPSADYYLRGRDGNYYEGIYGKLVADVEDFNINFITVYADELYNLPTSIYERKSETSPHDGSGGNVRYDSQPSGDNTTKLPDFLLGRDIDLSELPFSTNAARTDSLTRVFMEFDMLIIGFDDAYGDMPGVAAAAVLNFINNGKAVLMAHDVVSHSINPNSGQTNGAAMLPYLRDATRMDRYGVYNSEHGNRLQTVGYTGTPMIESLLDVSNNYSSAYSIAWRPGSNTNSNIVYGQTVSGATLRDVQGFGSHPLRWWNAGRATGNNTYNSFMGTTVGYENGWAQPGATGNNREPGFSGVSSSGSGGNLQRVTSRITQVNAGKITSYPYDINITDFSSPASFNSTRRETLDVGDTHGQWYTINMNLDDIVVWYSLSTNRPDNYRNYIHNDAANAYYIYNSGNVTYTGAGHSMDQGNTTGRNTSERSPHPSGEGYNAHGTSWYDGAWNQWTNPESGVENWRLSPGVYNEAQLFVNTMIAAYRPPTKEPEVNAYDADGNSIRYLMLPSDDVVLAGEMGSSGDESRAVYFRLLDGNLHADKSISLSLTFAPGSNHYRADPRGPLNVAGTQTVIATAIPVTEAGGNNTNRNGSLLSGVMYRFVLPDGVINALNTNGRDTAVTVRLAVTTENVPSPIPLVGYTDIVVQRIELFELS